MLTPATEFFLEREGVGQINWNHNSNHTGGIYLGPAVMLNFAINWLWGNKTKNTSNVDVGSNG